MSSPFKMKGHTLPGPNQRKKSPMKGLTGFRVSNYGKKSKTPKIDKFIGKALEFGANVATGGVYGTTKKYIKKQGGPKATFVKVMNKIAPPKKNKK